MGSAGKVARYLVYLEEARMDFEIPREIDLQYEGEWIAWDTVTNQVIGHGKTLDEAVDQAEAAKVGHLIWYHHILPRDMEIVGGF
jgi:hypothetical protein